MLLQIQLMNAKQRNGFKNFEREIIFLRESSSAEMRQCLESRARMPEKIYRLQVFRVSSNHKTGRTINLPADPCFLIQQQYRNRA